MRERGYMMVELMIYSAVLALFLGATTGIVSRMYRSDRTAAAYASDLAHCQRALHHLEVDLRQANRVETVDEVVHVHQLEETIRYTLVQGSLTRAVGPRCETVGRRIGALTVRQRGRLVELRIVLQPRAEGGTEAAVRTTIYLRNGGEG